MNKENLKYAIEQIPKFVLRDIAVDKSEDGITQNWIYEEQFKTVTEEGNTTPLCFASRRYRLIQFKDVFLPLIENIEDLECNMYYYCGFVLIDIFPNDDNLKGDGVNFGLVAYNSVNKTSSVFINFCIKYNDRVIKIPKKIMGFKKVHSGNALEITQNFLIVMNKVKEIWKTIIEEFSKTEVTEDLAKSIIKSVEIKDDYIIKKLLEKVKYKQELPDEKNMNVWEMFLEIMRIIETRKFKSELHKRKKLDLVSDCIFKYATITRLINA